MLNYLLHPFRSLGDLRTAEQERQKTKQTRELEVQAALEERQARACIMSFPEKQMTQTETEALLGAHKMLPSDFLETCPIGTWFMCRKKQGRPLVVGQVVEGDDLFVDQWGAGLSVPERGINRYRLVIA